MYENMCVYMYMCMYVSVFVCICVCMYAKTYTKKLHEVQLVFSLLYTFNNGI